MRVRGTFDGGKRVCSPSRVVVYYFVITSKLLIIDCLADSSLILENDFQNGAISPAKLNGGNELAAFGGRVGVGAYLLRFFTKSAALKAEDFVVQTV